MRRRMRLKTRVVSHNATSRLVRFSRFKNGTFVSDISGLVVPQDLQEGRARERGSLFLDSSVPRARTEDFELSDGLLDSRYYNPSAVDTVLGKPISRRVLVTLQGHRSTSGQSVVPRGRRYEFLGFDVPSSVLVCVRRKQRRQVLFAKGKNGRGNRRPRWNATSHIWC